MESLLLPASPHGAPAPGGAGSPFGSPDALPPGAELTASGETGVRVVCGSTHGMLLLPRRRILVTSGPSAMREVSPTEFERIGGKGTAKKWRISIRTADGGARARARGSRVCMAAWRRGCAGGRRTGQRGRSRASSGGRGGC